MRIFAFKHLACFSAILVVMSGCAQFPDLGDDLPKSDGDQSFPAILSLSRLVATLPPGSLDDTQINAMSLQSKAKSVPDNALTDADRDRLSNAFGAP